MHADSQFQPVRRECTTSSSDSIRGAPVTFSSSILDGIRCSINASGNIAIISIRISIIVAVAVAVGIPDVPIPYR